ncbi:endocuticle structural glycoprotein SgAbd-1-like [Daphnia pulex]|uniref:endocuticle structural glycoprotein SgAbd-1-like n=1 Tax=Daphnia pulex TaxID=6669 RepID=UPI001EE0D845|nr:endocuticle structural glycoprotein SgAbd-1-like [Daphnia pulex]
MRLSAIMGPLCTSMIFSLALVLSISAAPLIPEDSTDSIVTEIPPEFISSPIPIPSITPDLFLGEIGLSTSKPTELLLIPPPAPPTTSSNIISQYQEMSLDGDYKYGYVGGNGIEVEEKGTQKEIVGADGEKTSGTVSSGKYSYLIVGDGGKMQKMTVTWTADENGFRPVITISDA